MLDVLVVEDDPILLDFLVEEVQRLPVPGSRPVRRAASLAEARFLLGEAPPAWALLDVRLPDGSGMELGEELLDLRPDARIVFLSGFPVQAELPPRLLPNLHAVLSKPEGLAPLREAIWSLSRELDDKLPDISSLSPRQRQMLLLIGEGLDTAEIAELLGISFTTAQTHRRQITGRLGVKGARLVTLARELARSRA
jgi:DNA-binding NarL/FixJ family response regulator